MDLLADLLAVSSVRGTLGARIQGGRDWGGWSALGPAAAFHAIVEGEVWLRVPGQPALRLGTGDLVLLPHGTSHAVGSDPVAVARTTADHSDGFDDGDPGTFRMGAAPFDSEILCAHYTHDQALSKPVFAGLPDLLHIRAAEADDRLRATVALLSAELTQPGPGSGVVLDRLVDVLLVQALRLWLARGDDGRLPSNLCALRDPIVGAAVARIHAEPDRPWTTAGLADELAVSRATLARRFPATVGETPGAYLTRWRMDLAARRLRDTDDGVGAIARDVGYTSEPAFNRAFRRARGAPPGRWRAAARAAA